MIVKIALGIVLALVIIDLLAASANVLSPLATKLDDMLGGIGKSKTYRKCHSFMKTNEYASYIYPAIIILLLAFWMPFWLVLLFFGIYALSVLIYEFWRMLF